MDILEPERLEASPLKAAARRLTFGPRPAAESPDDTDLLPTVPVPADDAGDNGRPNEPDSPALADMRRNLDAVTAQLTQFQVTNIAALLQALYDGQAAMQQQIDRMTDRPTDRPTEQPRMTDRPTPLQQQHNDYDYGEQQYDQAIAAAAAAAAAAMSDCGCGCGCGCSASRGQLRTGDCQRLYAEVPNQRFADSTVALCT